MFKKILFPTDFSEGSAVAVPYVKDLAEKYGSKVYVLHVLYDIAKASGWYVPSIDMEKFYAELRKSSEDEIEKFVSGNLGGLENVEKVVATGMPADKVLSFVEENGIDLVVMGTHGRSGINRVLFGSTASKVVRHSGARPSRTVFMNSRSDAFKLGLFVVLSVILHIAAGTALYFLTPEATVAPEGPYIVRIMPPETQPAPQAEVQKAPPRARQRASVKRKTPPEPAPPPEELSSRPSTPEAPKKPLNMAEEVKLQAEETPPPAPAGEEEEAASETPKFPPLDSEDAGLGDRLFDPDVLAGVVDKGRKPKPPESSVTFDTEEIRHWGYMQRLKERIEYVWEYPPEAAGKGIYGDLLVRFVIKEDGSLGAVELVRTSGWRDLDSAAMQALRDGSPYWPLPGEWGTNSLTVTGHFIYTLHGSYYIR
jgi:protein TonB